MNLPRLLLITVFFILMMSLLSACSTNPVAPEPIVLHDTKDRVNIPEYLLDDCESLKLLEHSKYTKRETLDVVSDWQATMELCKAKHHELVKTVRKAFNLPSVKTLPSK